MKLVSWNCRGLDGFQKMEVIKRFKSIEFVSILLIQETKKIAKDSLSTLKKLWPKREGFAISVSGASGGLLSWWDSEMFAMQTSIEKKYLVVH